MTARRKGRRLKVAAIVGAVLAAALAGVAGNTLVQWQGLAAERLSPEALSALLGPHYRTRLPEGVGPFPTALLLSGCDGPHDNLDRWAERLAAEGWASVVVDSHTPRGLGEAQLWRLVCSGQLLVGAERAGDLLVALEDVRRMPFVDGERIVLIGSSHGGWTIMDLLAFAPPARLPYNLASMPGGVTDPFRGVVGAILLYPWCGFGNAARGAGWTHPAPVLLVLAGRDTIAPPRYCDGVVDALRREGVPVETVLFPDADHAFDQVDHGPATWLRFDAETTAAALDAGARFLRDVSAPRAPPDPRSPAGSPDR